MRKRVRNNLNSCEIDLIIEGLKKQRQSERRSFNDDKVISIIDSLISLFEEKSESYHCKKEYDVTPTVKKARKEYERIFFEKYGVKK